MRVVATEAFRAYHNHQAVNLNEGDVVKGSLARALLASRAPVRVIDEQPAEPETTPEASTATPARRRARTARPKDDG